MGALKSEAAGELSVSWSALTGAPSRIGRPGKALGVKSSLGAKDNAKAFLNKHKKLFKLSPQDIKDFVVSRDSLGAEGGINNITLQQQYGGIDVFGGAIRLNIDAEGRILNMSGEPIPNVKKAVNTTEPEITEGEAIDFAALHIGISPSSESVIIGLRFFPISVSELRLAWLVNVQDANAPHLYESLVDAVDGTVLFRKTLTHYDHIPAHGAVFDSDSPNPNTPNGSSTGMVARVDRPFHGGEFFPHDDPHYDWWGGNPRTTTTSNNVDAYADRDGDNSADAGSRPAPGAGEDFTFPIDFTMEPDQYQDAAVANLFYWSNRLHNYFYVLGFDEASGNFQSDNFGLGGSGGDPLRAEAQDNADGDPRSLCNANMSTPGDGSSPRMQMFLCDNVTPERDGDFDVVVIGHEYAHGVHSRLVPTSGNQRANEGWSDYFGLSVVAEADDSYDGSYGVGDYLFAFSGDGIRSDPYSTDTSVYQRSYADINDEASCSVRVCSNDDTQTCTADTEEADCGAGNTCDATSCGFQADCQTPNTSIDQGMCRTGVHRTGELWANALHIVRMNFTYKYGFNSGKRAVDQLVIDGMKLSPADPTFLDGRDSLLLADQVNNGGANACLIWNGFAKMGMGFSAQTTGVDDINPLEAFDVPFSCAAISQVNVDTDFGTICTGGSSSKNMGVFNTGSGELIVTSISRISGSDDITLGQTPELPVFISAGNHVDFTVTCAPSSAGNQSATFRIETNDTNNPQQDISFICQGGQPEITTVFDNNFGDVCLGDMATNELRIQNSGACELEISNITTSDPEFAFAQVMSFPMVVAAGGEVTVPIEFSPTGNTGGESANLSIFHNGENTGSPKIVNTSGNSPDAVLDVFIADSGSFGEVCSGQEQDINLTVTNSGPCSLEITNLSLILGTNAQPGDFVLPNNSLAGTVISPANSLQVPVRFNPDVFDLDPPNVRQASVEVTGRTLNALSLLPTEATAISGVVPPPDIQVAIANSGDFGEVCKGDHADLDLILFNQGKCDLTISDISLVPDAGDFELPSDLTMPLVLSHDAEFTVPVRFSPDECFEGDQMRTIEIASDDPDEMLVSVDVSGQAPCPNLLIDPPAFSDLFSFPPTVTDSGETLGCFSERTITLRNNGLCPAYH